jgi:peptidoglycan-associated lipoprotein
MRRAQTARKYLIDNGIDASRIDISSNGEERPVCQEHNEGCWQQNRRDEFVIVAGGDNLIAPR